MRGTTRGYTGEIDYGVKGEIHHGGRKYPASAGYKGTSAFSPLGHNRATVFTPDLKYYGAAKHDVLSGAITAEAGRTKTGTKYATYRIK